MATFNRTTGQNSVGAFTSLSSGSQRYGRTTFTAERIIDFSVAGNVNASADVFELLQIPAGYAIIGSGVEVLIADTAGNSGTIQVKLGSTAQGSAVAPSAAGYLATVGTFTPVVPSGTAAFLNLVIGTGAINAVVRLFAVLVDTRAKPGTGVNIGVVSSGALAGNPNDASPASYTLTEVL